MVDATVSSAINTLSNFVIQQVNIRRGVKDGVRWLKDELLYLQPSIRYAESRQDEVLIRIWINEVSNVASDAVSILTKFTDIQEDEELIRIWMNGVLDCFRSCVCICKKEAKLYDIGQDIESLKERIGVIKNRRIEYGIDNILATPNVQKKERTLLRTTAIDNEVDLIGFEDDIKTLMAELNSEDRSIKVISIHGMGGLGKTSLANKLYNSSELRRFDTRAKVCVSMDYNIKDVLKRIIKSFMGLEHEQYMSNMDDHDLLKYLKKLLQDRGRYFVVIDDIWDIKAWEQIKRSFPDGRNGSRIIITTRNKKVAERVHDRCFVHKLRFLTEEESWQLFYKRAEPATQAMEKLGKEMVDKCRGLPLAIVVLSGLLLHNKSNEYWSEVKKHIWRHLKDDSVDIVEILSLSYNDLSPQMRDCFLYLARYPEDQVIPSFRLQLLWIAEEFIPEAKDGEVVMEDLAQDYLNELINRNLIHVDSLELNGNVSSCRIHDLVRELAINKAKELKVLEVFDSSKSHPNTTHLLQGQARHVIYNGVGEYLELVEGRSDASYLRSLALVDGFKGEVEFKEMKLMHTRFKNLKVLDMRSAQSDMVPEEIGNLVHLKFLGLMGQKLSELKALVIPASIGKLKKLQSLWGQYQTKYRVTEAICKLHELRHLRIRISGCLNIGINQIKLRTLSTISFSQLIQIDTVHLTNLNTLYIKGEREENEGTLESIGNLISLQTFVLFFFRYDIPTMKPLSSCKRLKSVNLSGNIRDISELSFLPHSITDLTLVSSKFTEDPMPALGSLPNLTALELDDVYEGNKMVSSGNAFPSLQILRLEDLPKLEELQGAFPALTSLRTEKCENLKKIPLHLERFWKNI